MFKKRRIKKDFDIALAEGDDAKIEKLISENPWLQEYVRETGDDTDLNLKRICAAIGIMEDELNSPVPIDEILYSLEMDFNTPMASNQLQITLVELETKNFVKGEGDGFTLTVEGGRICDNYLNKVSGDLLDEVPGD